MYDQILFNRIKAADTEDIDGLVDIITDFGKGRVLLDSKDKEALIFAKNKINNQARYDDKEIKIICEQLQGYAGNTVVNWGRKIFSNSLMPYDDIVKEASMSFYLPPAMKTLGKLFGGNKINVSDRQLAIDLLGNNWSRLTFRKRYEASVRKARGAALGIKANPFRNEIGNGSPEIVYPFVIQMGYIELKRRQKAESKELVPESRSGQQLQTLDSALNSLKPIVWSQKAEENYVSKRQVALDKDSINTFSQLFTNIPSSATAKEASNTHLMLSNISFDDLTKAKKSPDLARGFKHGAKGIDEHVELTKAKGLQKAAMAGAIFNLASTAVAQKHLQDIAEELKQIKAEIKDIKQHLDDIDSSKIESLFEYINKVYNAEDKHSSEVQYALENKITDINESTKLFSKRISSTHEKSLNLDHTKFFSSDVYEQAQEIFSDLRTYCRLYFLSLQTYLVCNALRHKQSSSSIHYISPSEISGLLAIKNEIFSALTALKAKIELTNSDLRLTSRTEYEKFMDEANEYIGLIHAYDQDTSNLYTFMYPGENEPGLNNQSVTLLLEKDNCTEDIIVFLMQDDSSDLLTRQTSHYYAHQKR